MTEPVIDPDAFGRLVDMAGGDREFVAELIDTYLEDGERQLDQLAAGFAGGDAAGLLRAAHSLKTGSQNVGATAVAVISAALEADARTGSLEGAASGIDGARAAFAEAREERRARRDAT